MIAFHSLGMIGLEKWSRKDPWIITILCSRVQDLEREDKDLLISPSLPTSEKVCKTLRELFVRKISIFEQGESMFKRCIDLNSYAVQTKCALRVLTACSQTPTSVVQQERICITCFFLLPKRTTSLKPPVPKLTLPQSVQLPPIIRSSQICPPALRNPSSRDLLERWIDLVHFISSLQRSWQTCWIANIAVCIWANWALCLIPNTVTCC